MSMFIASLALALLVLWYLFLVTVSIVTDQMPARDALTYPARAGARWCLWRAKRIERWIHAKVYAWLGLHVINKFALETRKGTQQAFADDADMFNRWRDAEAALNSERDALVTQLLTDLHQTVAQLNHVTSVVSDVQERLSFYEKHAAGLNYSYEKLKRLREERTAAREAKIMAQIPAEIDAEVAREQSSLAIVK